MAIKIESPTMLNWWREPLNVTQKPVIHVESYIRGRKSIQVRFVGDTLVYEVAHLQDTINGTVFPYELKQMYRFCLQNGVKDVTHTIQMPDVSTSRIGPPETNNLHGGWFTGLNVSFLEIDGDVVYEEK